MGTRGNPEDVFFQDSEKNDGTKYYLSSLLIVFMCFFFFLLSAVMFGSSCISHYVCFFPLRPPGEAEEEEVWLEAV